MWQPRPSAWVLTVVCKAVYLLRPGESTLAPEQEAIREADEHWDDDPARSVYAPGDLSPVKPRAEVTLVGHAFAPGGQPVRSLVARLIVGELDKSVEVVCDRHFTMDGSLEEGSRFARMPLRYERAAGGPGTSNPVGVRHDARDAYGRRRLPNLQPIGIHVANPDDFIEPIGFGPLGPDWPARVERLGPRGAGFTPAALAEHPLPEGIDLGYFNEAPRDQQLAALRDNERLMLEHLHPEHPRLSTNLPGIRPAAFLDRGRGPGQRLAMRADSLWIETDRGLATLTWRGQIPLAGRDEPGRVLVELEHPGHEVTWPELERLGPRRRSSMEMHAVAPPAPPVAPSGHEKDLVSETMVPIGMSPGPALPFAGGAHAGAAPPPRPSSPGGGLPFQNPSLNHPSAGWPAAAPPPPPPPSRRAFESSSFQAVEPPPTWGRAVGPGDEGDTRPPAPMQAVSAASPPVVVPPAFVQPPAVVTARAGAESPWAGAASGGSAPARETLGMSAAAAAAVAIVPLGAADGAQSAGALGASNAAAGAASVPWSPPRRELRAVPDEAEPAAMERAPDPVQLLWFHPASVARMRRVARWKQLLDESQRKALDRDLDEADSGKEPWEIEDRQEVFEILARGERTDGRGVDEALRGSIREDGKLIPPLVLLEVDLELPFDELEALKAAVTTAGPLAGPGDEGLKASVGIGKEFLQTPGLSAAPGVCEGLTTRIREAFVREKKALAADYLDTQMERALLTGRHYQKREVFGGACLRALLWLAGEKDAQIGYLPAELAKKLPMYRRFRARVVVEVHPAQDQYEVRAQALRAVAIGRVGGVGRG